MDAHECVATCARRDKVKDMKSQAGPAPSVPSQEPALAQKASPFWPKFGKAMRTGPWPTLALFLPPALLVFTLFVVLPVSQSAYYAFFNWNGYGAPHNWVGFSNFERAFNDPILRNSLFNNLLVVAVSAGIQIPIALSLALIVSDPRRSNLVFRAIFFIPYILAEIVVGLIWKYLYDGEYGLVATIGHWFGWHPPFVLALPGWAMAAVLLVVVWKYIGFHLALFIAGRQNVPNDVIESARIDGASRWQVTRHIVLPMMKPVILLSLFFSVLGSFQLFDLIIPLTGGGPLNSTHSMVSYLYTFGIQRMRLGYGSAVALILFVVCVVVMACYKRFLLREDRAA
ncbi:MAG: raffinose/stachyose/melibiose transport system permease protein [Verrucomicrobiota bacterium]